MNRLPVAAGFLTFLLVSAAVSPAVSAKEPPPFFLAERDGTVGIWDTRQQRWLRRTQIPLESFSPQDQALLKTGLPLNSLQEASAAMEDFCS